VYEGREQWIANMTKAYKKEGLSDNAIKNLIAKNALESGWGKYVQGDFNFGNITAGRSWTGRTVQGGDRDATGKSITQKFRSYNSLEDYVRDELKLLKNLYDFDQDDDLDTFIGKLQGNNKGKRRYAEDLRYASKVKGVYNSI
jgi:flagellum-specific peptidoglycan hydrolase FlgJ